MAVNDHSWVQWGKHKRCAECGILAEQSDANCWRPTETNVERLRKALSAVQADFKVAKDGTVYYKGETDGSKA